MGKFRESITFSVNNKVKQAKSVIFALHEIEACPECKPLLEQINLHAKLGHPRVDS